MHVRQTLPGGPSRAPSTFLNQAARRSQPFPTGFCRLYQKGGNVTPANAASNTCVPNVRPPNQLSHVAFKPLPTPVNANSLQHVLQGYDPADTTFLVDGFIHGFQINYFGTPSLISLHNHPSASVHRDIVAKKLTNELSFGRIAGPFSSPPFVNFQSSPLGVVPKKECNAFRLIHDLSYPRGNSINEGIPNEFSTVTYETLDHVLSLLSQFGRGALTGGSRIIPIHPSCYHLFGFTWASSFFYDCCLPVGCAESCRIFERLSCALQWILQSRGNVVGSHILDDFIFIGPPDSPSCLQDLNRFMDLAHELSIPIKQEKHGSPLLSLLYVVSNWLLSNGRPAFQLTKSRNWKIRLPTCVNVVQWRCFVYRELSVCFPGHPVWLVGR